MNTLFPVAWFLILGLVPLSLAESIPRQKAEQIISLQRITMLFDGGSIQFRFELSSGSTLELILNDQEQMGGLLRGVPEQSAKDWWLWVANERARSFLAPAEPANQDILNMLTTFLKRNSDIDNHAREEVTIQVG